MIQKEVNIYALINPINKSIFYVGATKNPTQRLRDHISGRNTNYNVAKSKIIIDIINSGQQPELLVLDTITTNINFWEEFYISLFLSYGFTLTQKLVSGYTIPEMQSTPFFVKKIGISSTTYILRQKLVVGIRDFKVLYKNDTISDNDAQRMLWEDYNNYKKAHNENYELPV